MVKISIIGIHPGLPRDVTIPQIVLLIIITAQLSGNRSEQLQPEESQAPMPGMEIET